MGNDKSLEENGGPSGGVPHSVQRSAQAWTCLIRPELSAIRAAATRHALVLDDLAIKVVLGLDNAAKEHPAVHAGVGALEAGVVPSTLSSSWRGCGTLLVSIGAPPCGTGSGVRHHLRGHSFIRQLPVYTSCTLYATSL